MQRPIRPTTAGFCLGFLALFASPVLAQEKKNSETVRFDTFDQVEIKGTYWPSTRGKKAPVAMLLHKIGGKSNEDGWKDLAEELQKAGFAVLSFDFRGHGASVSVNETFWDHPMNKLVRRKPGVKAAETISLADFSPAYLPNLVNDITAAKRFLERRYNDGGDCNISNLVLIGAEDGATLGTLWLASEVRRHRIIPVGLTGQKSENAEVKDVAACVWINLSYYIGTGRQAVTANYLKTWLKDAGNSKEAKVPMAFIYGDEDKTAATNALGFVKAIRPKFDPKVKVDDGLTGTNVGSVAGSKLPGAKLLTVPRARETIVKKYLEGFILDEKKGLSEWEKRENDKTVYGWFFGPGVSILSNTPGSKHANPIPIAQFGFR